MQYINTKDLISKIVTECLFEISKLNNESLIIEGLSDLLYHFTDIKGINKIAETDSFVDNLDRTGNTAFFSFSRSKNANIGYARRKGLCVRITFDGVKLQQNFKGSQFDYYRNKGDYGYLNLGDDISGKEARRNYDIQYKRTFNDKERFSMLNQETEFEDRIEVDKRKPNKRVDIDNNNKVYIKNVSNYIIRIDVLPPAFEDVYFLSQSKLAQITYVYLDQNSYALQLNRDVLRLTDMGKNPANFSFNTNQVYRV